MIVKSLNEVELSNVIYAENKHKHPVCVQRGYIHANGTKAVIKQYKNSVIQDHINEINCLMSLSGKHSTFITYLGHFQQDSSVYIVMEDGGSALNLRLNDLSKEPVEVLHSIVGSLIEGFAVLESYKMYHRDIKPQNLLLDSNNRIKIIDFNLFIKLQNLEKKESKSRYRVCGTKGYMSPELNYLWEQGRKEGNYNLALSEVYSLGIIIWIILNRCTDLKFDKNNLAKMANCMQDSMYKDIVLIMLDKNPLNRKSFTEIRMLIENELFKLPLGIIDNGDWLSQTQQFNKIDEGIYICETTWNSNDIIIFCYLYHKYDFAFKLANILVKISRILGNCVRVLGAFEKNKIIYIAVDPFDMTLRDKIILLRNNECFFEINEILDMLRKVITDLQVLFMNDIYHFDINSNNLLIYPNNIYRLFGYNTQISQRIDKNQSLVDSLKSSPYLAPEILLCLDQDEPHQHSIEKSEVYSLGILIYETCTLSDPESIQINKNPLMTNLILSNFEDTMSFYLNKMLDPNPDTRASISELLSYLT